MTETEDDEPVDTPQTPNDELKLGHARVIRMAEWVETRPVSSLLICLAPALLAILSPNYLTQWVCLIWGLVNLSALVCAMLYLRDMRSSRRLIVSFASIIAVTQVFGSAYAATLLSSESARHFRFSQYSSAADYNNRRLATEILSDSHARAIHNLNAYVASQIESGTAQPENYPFDPRLKRRPCPNAGIALKLFFTCAADEPLARTASQLFKAELIFDDVFEIEQASDTLWIMRSRDARNSAVAAVHPIGSRETFFETSGGALLTFVYSLETKQRTATTRTDRRALIDYLSDIAKSTLREDGVRSPTLLPSDMLVTGDSGIPRIHHAVADALLCAQYARPRFFDGKCEPVPEFQRMVSEDGWDAPDASPGGVLTALRPLDYVLTAYLTEMLYWDIKSMERKADRRELVINGMIFSAMAVMTSGFADMSPTSYLAKFLLILQFLAYVLLIILILPLSFERPKEGQA